MSHRVCSGFHVLLGPGGRVVDNVFVVLLDEARARAEEVLEMTWDMAQALGYQLVETDVWSLR